MKTIKSTSIAATTLLILTSSVTPANADSISKIDGSTATSIQLSETENKISIEETIRLLQYKKNTDLVNANIKKLRSYVGKTWYVFSGATPSGWDCSGLTMWFYEQLGIELEHRATVQALGGEKVFDPKPGDIVAFHYENSKKAYHVGIYIGDGLMIHSPAPGKSTSIDNVVRFGGNYSDISYIRYIETI
jgi:cell wall-associated NlpC family hydrolase